MESFEKLEMEEGERYFQQDSDPKHTSRKATEWFEDKGIQVISWPAQSPDLNPIGHLWEHLKQQLRKYSDPPKVAHELWDRLVDEWNGISPRVCQNLIESMPRHIQAVIKANGSYQVLDNKIIYAHKTVPMNLNAVWPITPWAFIQIT